MTVTWFPLSGTLDTMEATDYLSDTLLPFDRLKSETRRYVVGERKPHFPVPATFGQVMITGWNVYRINPQGWDSETYIR